MVILIGGSSHVGKTFLSQKLLEELHYPYISLDHLKMAFIRTKRTDLTVEEDDEMREFLWPFAAEIVKTAVENRQNMIIEGCYIPADFMESIPGSYRKDVYALFLVMSEKYLRENIRTVAEKADVIEKRIADETDLERLINCSRWFKEECIRYGVPYYEIDGSFNIGDMVSAVLKGIEEKETEIKEQEQT